MPESILKKYSRDGAEKARREKLALGRKSFRDFCDLVSPEFFKPSRAYQDTVCGAMQAMYEKRLINPDTGKPYSVLIINLPPGFGKSYTACLFAAWAFGRNIKNQVITVSYMQDLAIDFSKNVRNTIQDEQIPGDLNDFVATSFFPHLKVKRGDGAMDKWALEGNYMSYLGTSFGGKLTGMRGNIVIIDDPIRDAATAMNDAEKARQWQFYKDTFFSRKLSGAMQVIIQTRWATDDLAGMIESNFPDRCFTLKMAALDENGQSLCEDLYTTEDLLEKRETIDEHIWSANFMQIPIDIKGALYGEFKTYQAIDPD
ncbi:MAG: terminase, partial [Defluviitaleaceae bacterium]|nr:terminase [Defluviitaleaceae bacterium]